jgi:lipopolysaccharide export system protein LptA
MRIPTAALLLTVATLLLTPMVKAARADRSAGGKTEKKEVGKKRSTVITSSSLDVDYNTNIAVFSGNVHVDDLDGQMWADKMVVHFNPDSREVQKLIATGKQVTILSRGRYSYSEKAVYTARDGKIVLTGDPRIRQGRNMYGADTITIFKDSDKTLFEPRARFILYSDEEQEGIEDIF